ncbi:MAG: AraC family transcriptional regulator ligand-binding domain-containing protein, partial [Lysobacterales bacterium]
MSRNVFPGYALYGSDRMIRRLGGDPVAIATATGVPVTVFENPSISIAADACLRYVELAAKVLKCDTFGMQLGAQVDLTFLGPVWVLMQDARTVQELLQDLQRHVALFTSAVMIGLVPTREGVEFSGEIFSDVVENDRQATEYCLCQV